jgi:hypothetical protein
MMVLVEPSVNRSIAKCTPASSGTAVILRHRAIGQALLGSVGIAMHQIIRKNAQFTEP